MRHLPIVFVLAPKSLGSRISGGALATSVRALRMMGHTIVKLSWATLWFTYRLWRGPGDETRVRVV